MTTTISLDFDTITFQSEYLNTGMSGLDFVYTKTCGDEETINLDSLIGDINNTTNTIEISASDIISGATLFPDGVYNIKLQIYDTDTFIEQVCIYIGTTSRCKARDLFESTDSSKLKTKLELLMFGLDNINLCDSCDCTKMCVLYNELISLINNTSTTTTNVSTDCGC